MHAAVLPPSTHPLQAADTSAGMIRPFAILAAIAFVVGFMGYLAVARTDMATLQARLLGPASPDIAKAAGSRPASALLNHPKAI